MDKRGVLELFRGQLALEMGCGPEDFTRGDFDNLVVAPAFHPERRRYREEPFFFHMTTFGGNAVIACDPALHPFLRGFVQKKAGHWLFEHHNLRRIGRELERQGRRLYPTFHMYLPGPDLPLLPPVENGVWLEAEELDGSLYNQFPNALSGPSSLRRDVLAAGVREGGRFVAMAGCSADAPALWQVGVDVDPAFRGRGLGARLVSMLTREILRRGAVPFYGTSLSNLRSQAIAVKTGYFPAWVEVCDNPDSPTTVGENQ